MRVKIFVDENYIKLEEEINEWLSKNGKGIVVKDIKFTGSPYQDQIETWDFTYSVLIMYE